MMKVGIIIVFWGKWPEWMYYTLQSFSKNPKIKWMVFSDQPRPDYIPVNVSFHHFTRADFVNLVKNKLSLRIHFNDPRKVCDFKPTFGKLFEDYLTDYDFWGYSDLDIIYGQLSTWLTMDQYISNDIISGYEGFLSGPFCLYRNTSKVNTLFEHINDYETVLSQPQHMGMDEHIQNEQRRIQRLKNLGYFFPYVLKNLNRISHSIREWRFQYQWYVKKRSLEVSEQNDMTEVAFSGEKQGNIQTSFGQFIYSDRYFARMGQMDWKLTWDRGILLYQNHNRKIPLFHFIDMKRNPRFKIVKFNPAYSAFTISKEGISYGT